MNRTELAEARPASVSRYSQSAAPPPRSWTPHPTRAAGLLPGSSTRPARSGASSASLSSVPSSPAGRPLFPGCTSPSSSAVPRSCLAAGSPSPPWEAAVNAPPEPGPAPAAASFRRARRQSALDGTTERRAPPFSPAPPPPPGRLYPGPIRGRNGYNLPDSGQETCLKRVMLAN